jgi:hypothetical protein
MGIGGEAPHAHMFEYPEGVVGAAGLGERVDEPARQTAGGAQRGGRGGKRVAEGKVAQEGAVPGAGKGTHPSSHAKVGVRV